jgi:hypothetical protein
MKEIEIPINPGKVLFGLSRIGYTPASAICDIIDNSVMAHASNIWLIIERESERYNDSRRGNVREYVIIDDGDGMSQETMIKALELGSPDEFYSESTLSKFGLGLKSATFSQGDVLEVISSKDSNFKKFSVSLKKVMDEGRYFATKEDLSDADRKMISDYLMQGHGTIIRVGSVRKEGHPSIRHTVDELRKKIGIIYYYFIKDDGVKITIDSNPIGAIDVLFTGEANVNGNLDENTWNGKEVRWIEKPKEIVLDTDSDIKAVVEITQLPHPPTFKLEERGGDARVREKYLIEAGNYGFYVYRNKRLISWAESFNGIIPYDQDFYSFRGRILVDDSADDAFNIDVKKSTLTLSDEAWNTISDQSLEYKRKSRNAWNRAKELLQERNTEETNQQSNLIIEELEIPDSLPGVEPASIEVISEVEKQVEKTSKERLEKVKKQIEEDIKASPETLGIDLASTEASVQIETTALKGEANPYAKKIFRVPYTEDNVLWEPYYDTDKGHCVRINKVHRFSKVLFEDNQENADMQVLFELFMHQLAVSEVESLKHLKGSFPNIEIRTLQKLLSEFRRMSSEYIANMCRKLEGKLPPLSH